jgi:hypothetical protein
MAIFTQILNVNENFGFVGCQIASLGIWFPTFQRNVLPVSLTFQAPRRNVTDGYEAT